ncbi:Do family serine endopeptidase [Sphingomicrobium lutaoense]|uniref:Probable periplasmic serine endoprotease DegP-like n=1 Tax=Sphingomicrobium lutaoense TaxID=515949 RepID=A0A839Z476_9SPHN|nr:Do family serine endopeptidase [Sphingomicrobium lutaoense]MBB3764412.1 serine protease Do [Sphingomicrobium lutaoense]
MRYAYGIAAALLLGGTAYSMTTGTTVGQVAQNAPRPVPVAGAPESFADLAERLAPTVVNISTRQRIPVRRQADPFQEFFRRFQNQPPSQDDGEEGPTRETGSLGSGFIISPDGYIVTNNHLIQSRTGNGTVDEVIVTLTDRTEYDARIVGRDESSDLALLKIDGANLPYVNWGNSDNVRVGDWVIAIGNPYGFDGTVTAGIVSAIQRGVNTGPNRYIQTDASINQGNSGGPMFDMAGNVVGVNSALISPTGASVGIGLAIPADQARPVIEALRRGERPQRGYLGVGLQGLDEDIAAGLGLPSERGELVRTIVPGEAAQKAGIRQGDVIIAINGQEVNQDQTVSYLAARLRPGTKVPVVIIRDGRRQTLELTVGERPTEEEMRRAQQESGDGMVEEDRAQTRELGMALQPLTDRIRNALRLDDDLQGVIITRVDPSSDAFEKGLRRGDVIMSVNRQRVTSPEQVEQAVGAARDAGRSSVLMLIKRGRAPEAFIGIRIAD